MAGFLRKFSVSVRWLSCSILLIVMACQPTRDSATLSDQQLEKMTSAAVDFNGVPVAPSDREKFAPESKKSDQASGQNAKNENATNQARSHKKAHRAPKRLKFEMEDEGSAESWDATFDIKKVPNIGIGTMASGPEPIAINTTEAFVPASITKVPTTMLALRHLGPEFQFTHRFEWKVDGEGKVHNLTWKSDGDPTLGADDFDDHPRDRIREMVTRLKKSGVNVVVGEIDLVSSDERLGQGGLAQGASALDLRVCYGAVAQAFNFSENCDGFAVTGLNTGHWTDSDNHFPIEFEMKEGPVTKPVIEPVLGEQQHVQAYRVSGTWNSRVHKIVGATLPVGDARSWVKQIMMHEMARAGIRFELAEKSEHIQGAVVDSKGDKITEKVTDKYTDKYTDKFVEFKSEPVKNILVPMDKNSDNFLADSLFRAVASREQKSQGNPNLLEVGRELLRQDIQVDLKLQGSPEFAKDLEFYDGSGVSAQNRATPRAFLKLLSAYAADPNFKYLWDSIPIAGVDGTLAGRMHKTAAQNMVRAKTGTVNDRGAYQLAGYVPKLNKATGQIEAFIPFVILTQTPRPSVRNRRAAHAFQDKVVSQMMSKVNPV